MTRDRLTLLLAAIVAACAGSGAISCAACPGSELDSSTPRDVDSATACDLATKSRQGFGPVPLSDCISLCDDEDVTQCSLDSAYMNAFDGANPTFSGMKDEVVTCPEDPATPVLTCYVYEETINWTFGGCPIEGRRPARLEAPSVEGSSVGAYLARCAHFEAASVVAFQVLAEDLRDIGAPAGLLADVREAEIDEVRHAAAMTRLARAYGAEPPAPIAPPRAPRPAVAIAIENAVEGVVREAFGAAVALHQASLAKDPGVRAALRAIAADECAHAALSFRIAMFLDGLLDGAERALVDDAKRAAIGELVASVEEPPAAIGAPLGLPGVAASLRMIERMQSELWRPDLAA